MQGGTGLTQMGQGYPIIWAVEILQLEESSEMVVSDTKSAAVSDTAANFSLGVKYHISRGIMARAIRSTGILAL